MQTGGKLTFKTASKRFLWPGMRKDISNWARECMDCQASKVNRHQHPEISKIPLPVRRFSHLHLDLVGPLQSSSGCRHLLTILDRTTRFPHAVPLSDISTESVWSAFLLQWIAVFGFPTTVITHRGTQFTGGLWQRLCQKYQIQHVTTSSYHPSANGLVERFHRRLKDALRARGAVTS